MNREPVENRLKYVTIQISWDAKQNVVFLFSFHVSQMKCPKFI